MDERLLKQWQITETLLDTAAAELSGASVLQTYRDFIEHNELEMALDVLEDAGHENAVSREYWWNLKKAAEAMGLRERYAALREQLRLASEAKNQGAQAPNPRTPSPKA
jgi:hypothetical protein